MNSDTRPNTRRNQGPKTAGARTKSSSHPGRNGSFAGFRSKFPKKKPASSPPQTPRGEASPPPNYKDFDDAAWEKYFAMEEALGSAGQNDYAAEARQQDQAFAERRPSPPATSWERQGRSQARGRSSGGRPVEGSRSPSRDGAWQPRAGSQGDSYRKAAPRTFERSSERRSFDGRRNDQGQNRSAPRQASAGGRFAERDSGRARATPPRSYGRDTAKSEGQPLNTRGYVSEQRGGRGKPAARSYERSAHSGSSQRGFQRDQGRFTAAGEPSGRPAQTSFRPSSARGHYEERGPRAAQERSSSAREAGGKNTWGGGHKKPSPTRFGEHTAARGRDERRGPGSRSVASEQAGGRPRYAERGSEQGQQGAPRSYGRHAAAGGQSQSRPAPRRPQHRTAPPGRYPSAEGQGRVSQGRSEGGSFRERSFDERPRPKKAAPGKAFHPASRQETRGAFDKPVGRSAKKSAKHARRDS